MKLIARHADGTKTVWRMNVKDPVQAIRSVSRVITAVTGAPPKTVLALVEDGKQDDIRNGTGVEPRKERDESDERN